MNVYNVVLTSIIVVFCDSLLSDRTTLNYLVVATLILTSTTTALCLLFLPKVLKQNQNSMASTSISVISIVGPQFHAVWRQSRGGVPIDPICHGTGLKLEFNTRRYGFSLLLFSNSFVNKQVNNANFALRMVVDDRKELLTRAEIMNRVYLRDIAKLDAEIQRLERILAKELNSSVSTLDDVTTETSIEFSYELFADFYSFFFIYILSPCSTALRFRRK